MCHQWRNQNNALIDPSKAPMLLGRICKHWRSVTYSTPRMWSSLHIPAVDHYAPLDKVSKLNEVVVAWLERSATCPLSISLSKPVYFGPTETRDDNSTVYSLLKFSRRLRHLELFGGYHLTAPSYAAWPRGSADTAEYPGTQRERARVRGHDERVTNP
jgi:hypothetical protein